LLIPKFKSAAHRGPERAVFTDRFLRSALFWAEVSGITCVCYNVFPTFISDLAAAKERYAKPGTVFEQAVVTSRKMASALI
jgi:hypothetical protein